jgi:hypothetical protein
MNINAVKRGKTKMANAGLKDAIQGYIEYNELQHSHLQQNLKRLEEKLKNEVERLSNSLKICFLVTSALASGLIILSASVILGVS